MKNHFEYLFGLSFIAVLSLVLSCKSTGVNSEAELSALMLGATAEAPICKGEISGEFERMYDALWPQKGENPEQASIVAHESYRDVYMKNILSAVPIALQTWYFKSGGKVRLIANAQSICKEQPNLDVMIPFSNEKGQIAGCLYSEKLAQPNVSSEERQFKLPEIYVGIDATSADSVYKSLSNMVQGFALMASHFATEFREVKASSDDPSKDGYVTVTFGNEEFAEIKDKIAFFFTDDLIKAYTNRKIASIPQDLLQLAGSAFHPYPYVFDGRYNAAQRESFFKSARSRNNPDYYTFVNNVFAQILAADMCSNTTRAQLVGDDSLLAQVGKEYYGNLREPLMQTLTASNEIIYDGSSSQKFEGLALTSRGVRFPILHGILVAPFVVTRFFIENRPVLTYLRENRPVATALRITVNTAAVVAGGVVRGTGKVATGVVRGTGRVAVAGGRIMLAPVRLVGAVVRRR